MNPLIETNTKDLNTAILLLWLMSLLVLFTGGAGKGPARFAKSGGETVLQLFKVSKSVAAGWTNTSCFSEFTIGFLFITGLLTRIAAATLAVNMNVATLLGGFKKIFRSDATVPCPVGPGCLAILYPGHCGTHLNISCPPENKMSAFLCLLNLKE